MYVIGMSDVRKRDGRGGIWWVDEATGCGVVNGD
jgi:hypothetical protein